MSTLKKIHLAALCCCALLSAVPASAAIISVGNLSTDTAGKIITDTTTGRSYSRLDAFDLTYSATLAAIAPNGAWAGWSIATATVADDFIAASLGTTSTACTGQVGYGTFCGTISGWSDGKLGASYVSSYDYFTYLNSYSGSGLVQIYMNSSVRDYEQWGSLTGPDGFKGSNPINYLLYKDGNAVPEPATLALFGLGMAGIGLARRSKQRAV